MRHFTLAPALLGLLLACPPADANDANDAAVAARVQALMRQMTLEEKVGQLHQLSVKNIPALTTADGSDTATMADIKRGRVGSLINVAGVDATRTMQAAALQSRLKIPLLFSLDVIHGYQTIFPIPLAESASWDLAAMEETARIAAREAAAAGVHWTFAPMVDISYDPRWGRVMEGAGEDTFYGAQVAAARVRGFQGPRFGATDRMLATAKHFVGYGAAIGGRDYYAADMSEQQLHENFLPPFKAAVDAGVATLMNAFNTLNGIPATGDVVLQRSLLKDRWGFRGFVVSDWNSIPEMVQHGYALDAADAAAKAITAGSDMDMEGRTYSTQLAGLVKSGQIKLALVDDAVRRVLTKKFELGLFDDPYKYSDAARERAALSDPAHKAAARAMAQKSMVLLKNQGGLLPLADSPGSIAVIGPLADARRDLQGAWVATVKANPADVVSVLDGIKARVKPGTRVSYAQACDIACTGSDGFAAAIAAASAADTVVLVLGEAWAMSGEAHSRTSIALPGRQEALFTALQATGKPIVVVLMGGRPLVFPDVSEKAPAILLAWFPGNEGGHAIADVLFGDYNPSGRLTVSFPRSLGQIPVFYQQYQTGKPLVNDKGETKRAGYIDSPNTPRYAFGFGLGYTTFRYADLKLSSDSMRPDGKVTLSVALTNTGRRAGEEVVQLYIRDMVASVVRPMKQLKGFQKVALAPGETRIVSFTIERDLLSFFNTRLDWVAEPGQFKLMVGGASDALALSADLELLAR